MIRQNKLLLSALFAAGTLALCAMGQDAQSNDSFFPPDPTIPNMWSVQLKTSDSETLDQVQKLGLKWVRRGFYWESIEKTKGVYDFSEYDKFMADCKAHGLSVIGDLFGHNKLYPPGHPKDEPARTAYAKYAAATAAHFKDSHVIWEIWNEPNTLTFWGVKPKNLETYAKDYTALVSATAAAIHEANPKAIVMAGSVSCLWSQSYEWMGFCFKDGILKTGIDAWSIHPYSPGSPEEYPAAYDKMRDQMVAAGGSKDFPLVNSERGFPISSKGEGYAGGKGNAHDFQAWLLVRQYLVDLMYGVKVTSWYEWSHKDKEDFALYEPGPTPNPAYTACKVLIEQLTGYRFDKRVDIGAPLDYVLRFTNDKGGVKLVAWTSSPLEPNKKPGGESHVGSPDKAVPHTVKIPVEATGMLQTNQIYGEQGTVTVNGGNIDLPISGAPEYVTVKN